MEETDTETQAALPTKGIKRKILEVLAVLGRSGKSDELRTALKYRGRNWRYFMTDLVDRGFLSSPEATGEALAYECASSSVREAVLERMDEEDRDRADVVVKAMEGGVAAVESVDTAVVASEEEPAAEAPPEEPAENAADHVEEEDRAEAPEAKEETSAPIEEPPTPAPSGRSRAAARRDRRRLRTGKETATELLRLASEALRRGDNETATQLAEDGVEGNFEAVEDEQITTEMFRVRGALAHLRAMRFDRSVELLEPITSLDQALADDAAVLAHLIAAECALATGNEDRSRELLVKIQSFAGEPSPEHRMRLAMLQAGMALTREEPGRTLVALRELEGSLEDPADRAHCSLLRGLALLRMDETEQAITPLQEALDICRNRGLANGEGEAALGLGMAFHQRAQYAKSDSFLERAERLARDLAREDLIFDVAISRATVCADRGDIDGLESSLEALRRLENAQTNAGQLLEARSLFLRNRVGDAIEELEGLTAKKLSDKLATQVYLELGTYYRSLGHNDAALAPLKEGLRRAERVRDRAAIARLSIEYAQAQLARTDGGERTSAVVAVKKAVRLLEFIQAPDHVWRGYHALGLIYLADGRYDNAFDRIGEATAILDQLLGRFRDRRGREAFLRDRYEPYRDRVVAFIGSRTYDSPLERLRAATHAEFLEFLRKNADADADTGPRYNEIGRLSASLFALYESSPPTPIEDVEQHNHACAQIKSLASVVSNEDAGTIAGELLAEGIRIVRARMGAVGLVDHDRQDAFEYFKGRNLPGREKERIDPIRTMLQTVARRDNEAAIDGRDRIDGPGEARGIAFPLPGTERYAGALILWYEKAQSPANQDLDVLRALVMAVGQAIRRELRLRSLRLQYNRAVNELEEAEADINVLSDEIQDLTEELDEVGANGQESTAHSELLKDMLDQSISYKAFMESVERDALGEALRHHDGDLHSMARALRFNSANLRKKLTRFGLIDES